MPVIDVVRKGSVVMDGDVEGHPFYGNQHIGGQSYRTMTPEQKVKAILKAKKILQPAASKKFSEAEKQSAKNLLAHAGAHKGKAAEKVAGVAKAPKSTENKQAKTGGKVDAAIVASKAYSFTATTGITGAEKPTLSITSDRVLLVKKAPSITEDDNPEGINQYTSGGAGAKSAAATKASAGAKSEAGHKKAGEAHALAAKHHKGAAGSASPAIKQWHEAMAAAHESASKSHSSNQAPSVKFGRNFGDMPTGA